VSCCLRVTSGRSNMLRYSRPKAGISCASCCRGVCCMPVCSCCSAAVCEAAHACVQRGGGAPGAAQHMAWHRAVPHVGVGAGLLRTATNSMCACCHGSLPYGPCHVASSHCCCSRGHFALQRAWQVVFSGCPSSTCVLPLCSDWAVACFVET
jgi:hypothetical protein